MVGLKTDHIRKNLTQKVVIPRDIAGERKKKKPQNNNNKNKTNNNNNNNNNNNKKKNRRDTEVPILKSPLRLVQGANSGSPAIETDT